jgi:hypothetical protein
MNDPADDRGVRRHRVVPVGGRVVSRVDVGTHPLTAALPAHVPSEWAAAFVVLLQNEIRMAARRGVMTRAEGEQLLARLVVVIDQALSTR